jgi:hypothetical protein
MDALYQRATAMACSIAWCDASEKSTGQRIRVIGLRVMDAQFA